MKTVSSFILTFLSISISSYGQTQIMDPDIAENYFSNKRFAAVWPYYQELLKADASNPDLNFKMGVCYLNSRSQKEKAFDHFKKAMSGYAPDNSGSGITYKLLADACYQASNYDDAILNYEKHEKALRSKNGISRLEIEDVEEKIEMCRMAKELKELKTVMAAMTGLENVNKDKHSCTDSGCTITRVGPSSLSQQNILNGKNYGDKYYSEDDLNYSEPNFKRDGKNLDTSSCLKEATIATSADGQIILIYSTENADGSLYVSGLNGNEWTAPEKLCKAINNKSWEPNEFLSADGNTLYFSSAREGGFGGKDIYKCTKLANGDWSKAFNLGPEINSSYDEIAPFIHPDLRTLYFSSNRLKAKDGYDIFTSTLSDSGLWRSPVIVGYRIHKPGEYAFKGKGSVTKTELKKEEKEDPKKKKENYLVTFAEQKKIPLTMVKGTVVGKDGKIPEYVEITVTDNETGEVLGVYNADSKTGKYAFILPPEKNNTITFEAEGYLYHTENIDISKKTEPYKVQNVVELVPLATGSKDVLSNLFFEEKKAVLSKTSTVELDKIYDLLFEKGTVEIEISACISKECSQEESKLAENKIQAVTNYLVEKGINKERVSTRVYKRSKRERKNAEKDTRLNNENTFEIKILNI